MLQLFVATSRFLRSPKLLEGELPKVTYHRQSRGIFTLKRNLDKLSQLDAKERANCDSTDSRRSSIRQPKTADVITRSLCLLFNQSRSSGTIPMEWKLANTVPVFKKGDRQQVENYRPISLLPIVSKVLERCILNNIQTHLYNHVGKQQHGFLTGKSCTINLIETLERIGRLLDRGSQTDVIYLDISKAYDKVNHAQLLSKLHISGFGGKLYEWFQSYLTGRLQRVTVLGATSDALPVTSGVPQGSILGPALFLLYVNDLPNMVSESETAMFADDTKFYKEIRSTDDKIALQMGLNNIGSWCIESGLEFNEKKSQHQSITRKIKPLNTPYDMNGAMLEKASHERDLSVWVSTHLTWNRQVLEQCSRADKLFGFAKRNTRYI